MRTKNSNYAFQKIDTKTRTQNSRTSSNDGPTININSLSDPNFVIKKYNEQLGSKASSVFDKPSSNLFEQSLDGIDKFVKMFNNTEEKINMKKLSKSIGGYLKNKFIDVDLI